jgi:hypothetical protein
VGEGICVGDSVGTGVCVGNGVEVGSCVGVADGNGTGEEVLGGSLVGTKGCLATSSVACGEASETESLAVIELAT